MKKPKQSTMAMLFNSIAKELKLSKSEGQSLNLNNNFVNGFRLIEAMSKFYRTSEHRFFESYSGTLLVGFKPDEVKQGVDPELAGLAIVLKELSTLTHLFDKNSLSLSTFEPQVELVGHDGDYVSFVTYAAIDLNVRLFPSGKYEYVIYENPDIEGYFDIGIYVSRTSSALSTIKEMTIIPADVVFGRKLNLELGDLAEFIKVFSNYARAFKDRAVDTVKLRDLIQVEEVYCLE